LLLRLDITFIFALSLITRPLLTYDAAWLVAGRTSTPFVSPLAVLSFPCSVHCLVVSYSIYISKPSPGERQATAAPFPSLFFCVCWATAALLLPCSHKPLRLACYAPDIVDECPHAAARITTCAHCTPFTPGAFLFSGAPLGFYFISSLSNSCADDPSAIKAHARPLVLVTLTDRSSSKFFLPSPSVRYISFHLSPPLTRTSSLSCVLHAACIYQTGSGI